MFTLHLKSLFSYCFEWKPGKRGIKKQNSAHLNISKHIVLNNQADAAVLQSVLFHCQVTLHVSGVLHTHHQEYNFNCIYSLRYKS